VFYKIVNDFKNIIKKYEIKDYKKFGRAKGLVAKIEFIDGSVLHIREYIFLNSKRKYSFHWQDKEGNLIVRWDNSPHHFHIKTFPDHKHIGNKVFESEEICLEDVVKFIERHLLKTI